MIAWSDEGIVLAVRRHGENAAIVSLLTRAHGRRAGLVRGGTGKRARGVLQPGNLVAARFNARLEEHLGHYQCELLRGHAGAAMASGTALARLAAACAVAEAALPEEAPAPRLFAILAALVAELEAEDWVRNYLRWEVELLAELGYGLDLSACAATGGTEDLGFVSPRTGRAVSRQAGAPYRDRLLALPAFLLDPDAPAPPDDLRAGFALTGHFLERHALAHRPGGLPAARIRLVERLAQ